MDLSKDVLIYPQWNQQTIVSPSREYLLSIQILGNNAPLRLAKLPTVESPVRKDLVDRFIEKLMTKSIDDIAWL